MIIGYDGSRAFVKDKTGTENYSFQLLKSLAKIDRDNTYYVYLRPGNKVNPKEWPSNFTFQVLNIPRLWTQLGLSIQTFFDPLDVLFVTSHTIPLVRKPGLKTVMTVHDLGAEYLPCLHQLKQALYLKWITKFQLKTATSLIAVSQATKKDLISKVGIDPQKITVIYEGFSTPESAENDVQVDTLKQFDINKNSYFLFVGTIQPRKNLVRLIDAFNVFKKTTDYRLQSTVKLVLAGGKGWQTEEIYAHPKRLEIEDQVVFTGRVSDAQLADLYKNCLGFVFPSLFEGFGLPILEAFHYKAPVITSKVSSMPEVAGDAALLVDPEDINSIAEAMQKLAGSEKIRSDLVKKGEKQLQKFSWDKAAEETLELLGESVKQKG